MGILSSLLGGGLGEKITEVISKRVTDVNLAANLAAEARKLIEDHEHERTMKVMELEAQIAKDQASINLSDAQSGSIFKGGWRPMVGWVCVSALAYQMVFRPLLAWLSTAYAWMPPPSLEMDTLLTLLFAILGLGAYRSYDKAKGTAS